MKDFFRNPKTKWSLTRLAGTGSPGHVDGLGEDAKFYSPMDIALSADEKTLFVADFYNHAVRKVNTKTGQTSTLRVGSAGQHIDLCYPTTLRVGPVTGYVYVGCNDSVIGFVLRLHPNTGAIIDFAVPFNTVQGITSIDLNKTETKIYGQGLANEFFGNYWNYSAFIGPIGSPTFLLPIGGGFNSVFGESASCQYFDNLDILMSATNADYLYSQAMGYKAIRGSDGADLSDIEGHYGYSGYRTPYIKHGQGSEAKFQDLDGTWHLIRYTPEGGHLFDMLFQPNALDLHPGGGPWTGALIGGAYYEFWRPTISVYSSALTEKATLYFSDNPMHIGVDLYPWSWQAAGGGSHSIYKLEPTSVVPPCRQSQRGDSLAGGMNGSRGARFGTMSPSRQKSSRRGNFGSFT